MRQQHRATLLQAALGHRQLPLPRRRQRLLLLQPPHADVAGCSLLPRCCLLLQQHLNPLARPQAPAVKQTRQYRLLDRSRCSNGVLDTQLCSALLGPLPCKEL